MHLVHFAGGQVVVSGERDVQETLIVAKVEIHLQIDNLRLQGPEFDASLCPVSSLENTMQVIQARQGDSCLTSPPSSRTNTSPCSKGDMVPASVLR